jgi:ParB family chromosome partitioning protein
LKYLQPSDVLIGERARKDLGDLGELARSIKETGLLHPIVVSPDHELICGACRLAAWQQLFPGKPIPAYQVSVPDMLAAELDENLVRCDLLPSERLAVANQVEAAVRANRESAGLAAGEKSGDFAARRVGWSRPTLSKVRIIAAVSDGRPPGLSVTDGDNVLFAKVTPGLKKDAQRIRKDLDKHGKVDLAYKQLREVAQREPHLTEHLPGPLVAGRRTGQTTAGPGSAELSALGTLVEAWREIASLDPDLMAKTVVEVKDPRYDTTVVIEDLRLLRGWLDRFLGDA